MTIDSLVSDLKPAPRFSATHLWAYGLIALFACAVWVLTALGLRPELQVLTRPMPIIKPLLLLSVALLALGGVAHLARPGGRLPLWAWGGTALIVVSLLVGGVWESLSRGESFWAPLSSPFIKCWIVTLVGGAISYAALWALWLRRAAPSQPMAFGALSGLAISALMATAYTLHCRGDMAVYILVYYGAPLVLMTLIGAALGRWLYRW